MNFGDFTDGGIPAGADYVVGYAAGDGAGSDRRWRVDTLSRGIVTLEMFGGVGDGVTDDAAAWAAAWQSIMDVGGGFLEGLPGKTYYLNLPYNATGQFVQGTVHNAGMRNIKLLTSNTFNDGEFAKILWFQNINENLIFENIEITAWDSGSGAFNRGTEAIVLTGVQRLIARNCKMTGGRVFFYGASQDANALDSNFIVGMENIETVNCHYPVVMGQSGGSIAIDNLVTTRPERSLFVYAPRNVRASVRSYDSLANDVDITLVRNASLSNYTASNIDISYTCTGRTLGLNSLSAVVVVMRSDGVSGGAVLQNARFNFDVTVTEAAELIQITRQTEAGGSEVGNAARGHVVDNVTIGGKVTAGNGSSLFNLFTAWPSGETVRNIQFRDFLADVGAGSVWNVTTTPFSSSTHMSLENIKALNTGMSLLGTPGAGSTVHYRNYEGTDGFYYMKDVISVAGTFTDIFKLLGLVNAVNDGAASAGGVAVGQVYRNGSVLMVRVA